jgi:GntR family transcriptional regulator, carbon starvation induced regulator
MSNFEPVLARPTVLPTGEKTDRSPMLSETAFRVIRQQILRGEIPPGEKLRIEVLQREHTLSSSPLREALNRLVAEGLVIADDHRGFRAAPMSASDLKDITNFRLVIEPSALAQSIANGNDEWEGKVVAAFHRLEKIEQRIAQDQALFNEEWTERHKEFHMSLLSSTPSSRLFAACSSLFDQAERYRRFSAMNRTRPRDTTGEHRRLMETAIARQTDLATALLRDHMMRTAENVIAIQQTSLLK